MSRTLPRVSRTLAAILGALAVSVTPSAGALAIDPSSDAPDSARAALVDQLIPLQADLRKSYPDSFGGLWVDDSGQAHVAIVGDQSAIANATKQALGSGAVAIVEAVSNSEDALNSAMATIVASISREQPTPSVLGVQFTSIRVSIQTNEVIVRYPATSTRLPSPVDASLASIVRFDPSDEVIAPASCTSRSNCGGPLKAGLTLFKSNGTTQCQSAFVMKDIAFPPHYFLTSAGHCWDATYTYRYHPVGVFIGSSANQYHSASGTADAMRFPITTANASNQLYVSSSSIRTVTSEEFTSNEVLGEGVCSSKLSGNSCGALVSKSVCTPWVCGQRAASGQYACGGDSGSPVYYSTGSTTAKAMGILIASSTGTHICPDGSLVGSESYYTHISNAEGVLNVTVAVSTP